IFPKFSYNNHNSMEMANLLLDNLNISVVPGIAFGPNGEFHLRFSFSNSIENIKEAIDRMKSFFV
ncbi:MAG: pyridoxal phosphate-dependent aminotransferase, partial [Thermoplasmata archaeon]